MAIDNRGYGDSEKPSGVKNYSIDKLTGDVKNLILGESAFKMWLNTQSFKSIEFSSPRP